MKFIQELKRELQLNRELRELLEVLKGIASSQFRILQKEKAERFAKFLEAFEGFFQLIDFSTLEHPFSKGEGKLCIIMVTSDEGFMGGLNTRVINTALEYEEESTELVVLGERGAGYLRGLGKNFVGLPGIGEEKYEDALRLKDFVVKEALAGKFKRVILVYPKPITFTVQRIEVLKLLPCSELFEKREDTVELKKDVIIESTSSEMIEYLVDIWITQKLLEVFEDSKLAEFSARTIHLEQSNQGLMEIGKGLRIQYFRARHELVDRGMRETFSSQLIRKKER